MTQSSGIVSVSHETSLPSYSAGDEDQSPIRACGKRWEHLQDQVRELPWAQCPPEMSADFVRSMARELLQNDGDQAAMRAALFTASIMAEQKINKLSLSARHPKFGASMQIDAQIQPYVEGSGETQFEVAVPREADDEAALDVLRQVGEGPATAGSPFDPIAHTPDIEVAKLLASAEKAIGASSYETLVVAALPLLAWKKMEDMNAGTLRFQLAGLHDKEGPTLPDDQCVVFNAQHFGMQPSNDAKAQDTRTVRVRSPR